MRAKFVRQGDVALVPVSALPAGAKDITPKKGDVILKTGEATGHSHRLVIDKPNKVRVFDAGAERFIQVMEAISLRHEEHAEIVIAPGIYQVPDQCEWSDENEPRRVAD